MTGYGKAECCLPDGKIIIEIRSLNGKNADISIKTQLIPRDKDLEVRQLISKELHRGNIDLYASLEQNAAEGAKVINKEIFTAYYNQIRNLGTIYKEEELLPVILRLPDIIEVKKQEFTQENWEKLLGSVREALVSINEFRRKEGDILYKDITGRVGMIESFISEIEKYEPVRTRAVKEKLKSRIEELGINPDENRLEQEIIYYIEKLDINEEKVRLRQHCRYFIETINNEQTPGKKLGFIAQEMGREINTIGSKANHADIQQWVVKMKDELEKIKEQSLNIL